MQASPDSWPQADAGALAHSERLTAHLRKIIAERGALAFSQFMQEVLYAPGLGYYAAGARKFGADGDFVTSPEISPLFAKCVATQAMQVLRQTGGDMLELGAGSGVFAKDALDVLASENCLPDRYFILEPAADLRERQQALIHGKIPQLAERVIWCDAIPVSFRGFVFGNEVVDAFPVERFTIENSAVRQFAVALDDDKFAWRTMPPGDDLLQAVKAIETDIGRKLEEGYVSEINLFAKPWVGALADSLEQGAIVLLDYGYPRREFYMPQRADGTLRCYYQHRAHADPFLLPGLQDITSHVDFTALVEAAVDAGLELQGFTNQAQFLLATRLLEHAEATDTDSALERARLSREVQQLTLPGAMGESFCAVGLSKGVEDVLIGFDGIDQSHRL